MVIPLAMQTILLVIPNYVYSSDLLRTNFIITLAARFRVVVLSPLAPAGYPEHPNIIYLPWKLQFPAFWTFWGKTIRVPLIRMFDHEPLIQRNYQLSFGHWKRKLLRRLAFLFPKRFWNPNFIARLEMRFLPACPAFDTLVREHRPSLILVATPGFTEMDAEAILLARRAPIPTVAIDFSWDNLTSNCKHLRKTDHLICWTERMREQAIRIHGFPPERVSVSGIMRFDLYFRSAPGELSRDAFLRAKGLDPREKTILTGGGRGGKNKDEPTLLQNLIRERDRGAFPGHPNIFVRIHPKEDNFAEYAAFSKSKNVRVERGGHEMQKNLGSRIELGSDDLVNLKDTLRHADVVVNYASTITLEACVFDKPVVNIGFPPYYLNAYSFTHYQPVVASGAVRVAKSYEELVSLVSTYLREPGRDREGRARAVREFIGYTDGESYERVVDAISRIVMRVNESHANAVNK